MRIINFTQYTPLYFTISAVALIVSIASLGIWGLRPAIDFTGGTLIQLSIVPKQEGQVTEVSIRQKLNDGNVPIQSLQSASGNAWIIKTSGSESPDQAVARALTDLGTVDISRLETIGPTLGRELLSKTGFAILIAAGAIMFYVGWRFRGGRYGACAILAMVHDSLIVLGAFSLFGRFLNVEVDTLFVTALLTILSFSVHDTIVVFDRIRENLGLRTGEQFTAIVNRSLTETMRRSINNSLTIMMMLAALVILGGQTTRAFSLALLIGTITGTYSSPFVAAPLLVMWERISTRNNRKKAR